VYPRCKTMSMHVVEGYIVFKSAFEGRAFLQTPPWSTLARENTRCLTLRPEGKRLTRDCLEEVPTIKLSTLSEHGSSNALSEFWISVCGVVFNLTPLADDGMDLYTNLVLVPQHAGKDQTWYFAMCYGTSGLSSLNNQQRQQILNVRKTLSHYFPVIAKLDIIDLLWVEEVDAL